MRVILRCASLGALAWASISCNAAGADTSGTVVTDSAGVELAVSPAMDRAVPWTLTEVFRLGGEDEGPGSFTTANPFNVATDAAGRIYVLDAQQFRVEVFTPSGEPLRFLGRQGGGPGELQFPISLFVAPSGVVHVFDVAKRAQVRWDAEGELLEQHSVQGVSFGTMRPFGDTLIFDLQVRNAEERSSRLVRVIGADTVQMLAESGPPGGMVQFSCVAFTSPPVFTPTLQWNSNGRLTAASLQTPYQVDLFRDGRLVRRVRRPIVPRPASVEDVGRVYPDGMRVSFGGGAGCTIPASEIMEKQGVAESVPLTRGLMLDPQGRLWVERYTFTDEPGRVDIFDGAGRYLGTLTGKGAPLGFPGSDVVIFAEEHEDTGIRQVVAYRISGAS